MTYPEALAHLFRRQEFTSKLSLDTLQTVLKHLPFNPGNTPGIQVGGTNGKGSTCHYIAAMLQSCGHRVGLFTSPHLQTVRERISIQGEPVSPDAFAKAYSKVDDLSRELIGRGLLDSPPTFFESVFLTALYCFHASGVTLIVWEVGLGGRLDATSTLVPALHVITNISLEHTRILGKTLGLIAAEKAGMIKPGVPVVCGCHPRTVAYRRIRDMAVERSAPFHPLYHAPGVLRELRGPAPLRGSYELPSGETVPLSPRMLGRHQVANAALAVLAIDTLTRRGLIPSCNQALMAQALQTVQVPGRVERLSLQGAPTVYLDGGHNLDGIQALVNTLQSQETPPLTIIFGVLGDKSYRKMALSLLPICSRIILVRPDSHRALEPEKLRALFEPHVPTTLAHTPQEAWSLAQGANAPVLITGSLYLAGTFRNLLLGEPL